MLNHEVAAVLRKKLGLGEFPLVRERLFSRLQRLCIDRGDVPLTIIAQVLEESQGARVRNAGKYFAFTVTRRLTTAGFWTLPGTPNETEEEHRATVQRLKEKAAIPVAQQRVETDEEVYNRVAQQRVDDARRNGLPPFPGKRGAL